MAAPVAAGVTDPRVVGGSMLASRVISLANTANMSVSLPAGRGAVAMLELEAVAFPPWLWSGRLGPLTGQAWLGPMQTVHFAMLYAIDLYRNE